MLENEKIFLNDLIFRYPVLENQRNNIWKAYHVLEQAFLAEKKLLVAGNGGSAADAEHIVGELMKGFIKPRKLPEDMLLKLNEMDVTEGIVIGEKLQGALPAIALTNHTALSTAYLNDVEPLLGFAQQVYGYGHKDDVFFAISTSGSSKNIIYAATVARAKGMRVVGLTGRAESRLSEIADVCIRVPQKETYKIQELHLPVYHCLCLMLEEHFFGC